MIHWDTTHMIVAGLVIMGMMSVIGYYGCMIMGVNITIEPTISIVTGLFSAIGVVTGATVVKGKKPGDGARPPEEPKTGESGPYGS